MKPLRKMSKVYIAMVRVMFVVDFDAHQPLIRPLNVYRGDTIVVHHMCAM